MPHLRPRDARAIAFWIATSLLLLVVVFVVTKSVIAAAALLAAYNAWLLTRPRMRRVFRRLRGETVDFSGYYYD
jgi:threonine/homoserine/homoserine lactone efflux protein